VHHLLTDSQSRETGLRQHQRVELPGAHLTQPVLRNGVTDRAFAGARLDSLQRLPIRILGAVLNDVRASEGMYRYYTYIPGYRSEDEIASEDDVHRRLIGGGKKT
jgi:hypothetical protein